MIHRPVTARGNASIWISYSNDLIYWGDHRVLLQGRGGNYWDGDKVGGSPPLVRTDDGWLMIYHSGKHTPAGCLYRCGLALLDLEDPSKVISRHDNWVFGPMTEYERSGDVGYVVFPCGIVPIEDKLRIYYGAADTSIGLATVKLKALMELL